MDGLIELIVFFGILYYFFSRRASKMVDVISTRVKKVYANWESRTDVRRHEDSEPRLSLDGLRRAAHQSQRKRIQARLQNRAIHDKALFKIKEGEPQMQNPTSIASYLYNCCRNCSPGSRESLVNTMSKEYQNAEDVNILLVHPGQTILSKCFNHITKVYSFKKNIYPKVTQSVLDDERLNEAIKLTAQQTVREEQCDDAYALSKATARAKELLAQMQSNISDTLLRITAWILYKVLPCFVQAAVVQPYQVELLKKANATGLPLVFLPLHKSHLDYVMITFILLTNNIKVPLIAAGNNLKIPFFGWLLSGLGAFFIKRRIDPVLGRKDILYRAVLQTYVMECMRAGHNVEFFLEGGRTRTGKPCFPKGGILSIILDAYMDGTVEDALLVPITINYERLVDGNFVREQLGQQKKMETFGSTLRGMWSTLMGNYGIVKVNICQPFSLREMIKSLQVQQNLVKKVVLPIDRPIKANASTSSLYGTDVVVEEHRQLVDCIGKHVIYDCSASTPIMSTNIVAFLLLNKFRDGCALEDLVEAFDNIKEDLKENRKDLAFYGETIDVINHALDILGPGLVKQQRQAVTESIDGEVTSKFVTAIRPVAILPNVIETSYYAYALVTHYVLESVIVSALYAELHSKINDPREIAANNVTIYHTTLVERALKVCDILRYEFIFCKPCEELSTVIVDKINQLCYEGLITLKQEPYLAEEYWTPRRTRDFDDDSSEEEHMVKRHVAKMEYKVNLNPDSLRELEFYHTLLRPLIDTYALSAFTLKKIVKRSLTERDLVHEILSEIKTNLDRGLTSYGESLCVDPIKNAIKLFEKWNVLESYPQENVKIFYLKDNYDSEVEVGDVYDNVGEYRWIRNVN